jgi:thiazole synthase
MNYDSKLTIANKQYNSRLLVGTGRYSSFEQTKDVIRASSAQIITVSLRRINLSQSGSIQDYLPPSEYTYLPNTAGCYTAEEAVRTLRLAREAGSGNLAKLEVIGDKQTLYPNMTETLKAAKILVEDGFDIMVYCTDDPVLAKVLEEIGCAAIMPLASPIGSGLGILNSHNIKLITKNAQVPVIVDAGIGTASDAAFAMELGCDGVLMNTAISDAESPMLMASAMKAAVEAGRLAFLAGRMQVRDVAQASSPQEGII